MNRVVIASAIVAIAALTAAPVFAATAKPATTKVATAMTSAKPKAVTFKTLDTNKDGKISLAEIDAVWPQITKAEFDKFAKKKAGELDHAELAALVKAQQPAKAAAATTAKPAK